VGEKLLMFFLFGVSIGIIVLQALKSSAIEPNLFFVAGGFLLVAFLLAFDLYLSTDRNDRLKPLSISKLVVANMRQSRSRSLVIVVLLAITTFIVVATGMYRQDMFGNARDKKSGTGGFLFVAESTMPLLNNLNDQKFRKEQGFAEEFSAVHFFVADGDDASCLNLNRISNPRVLGVDASQLEGRFSFQTFADDQIPTDEWKLLQKNQVGCIAAIADQTVIQWSLGKKVGDTLTYQNSHGEQVKLLLVAGLKSSVFQGNILIGKQQFLQNFASSGGSKFFLIDGETQREQSIAEDLELQFRELGLEIVPAAQRLAEFKTIENTYLSIFLILGALGLLIGTIGLAVIMERTLLERKAEFSVLSSLGYSYRLISKVVTSEYLILLIAGILIGFITAIISVLPVLLSSLNDISPWFVFLLMLVVIVNGTLWIVFLTRFQLRKLNITSELRNE